MTWSFIKDTLGFTRRHWRILIMLVLPIQLVLVGVFEVSNIEGYVAESMRRLEMEQNPVMVEYESEEAADAAEARKAEAEAEAEAKFSRGVWGDSEQQVHFIVFALYLILSVVPVALVILYVRAVFAGESPGYAAIYAQAIPLSMMLLGYYGLVWGLLAGVILVVYNLLTSLGLVGGPLSSLLITILVGSSIYVHHRLSLGPYFWREKTVSIVKALELSWLNARFMVFILIFGNSLLYISVLMIVSFLSSLAQSVLPMELQLFVRIVTNIAAGFGGILQTVFMYRVYSFILEKQAAA